VDSLFNLCFTYVAVKSVGLWTSESSGPGDYTFIPDHRFTACSVRGCGSFYEPAIYQLDSTKLILAKPPLLCGLVRVSSLLDHCVCYPNIYILCIVCWVFLFIPEVGYPILVSTSHVGFWYPMLGFKPHVGSQIPCWVSNPMLGTSLSDSHCWQLFLRCDESLFVVLKGSATQVHSSPSITLFVWFVCVLYACAIYV
jgi:hypothetical protein